MTSDYDTSTNIDLPEIWSADWGYYKMYIKSELSPNGLFALKGRISPDGKKIFEISTKLPMEYVKSMIIPWISDGVDEIKNQTTLSENSQLSETLRSDFRSKIKKKRNHASK